MPRSHDIASYPTFYFEFVQACANTTRTFSFQFDNAKLAHTFRTEWYSFVHALNTASRHHRAHKDLDQAQHYRSLEVKARNREAIVRPLSPEANGRMHPHIVHFIAKDETDRILNVRAQFERQVQRLPPLPSHDDPPVELPAGTDAFLENFLQQQ